MHLIYCRLKEGLSLLAIYYSKLMIYFLVNVYFYFFIFISVYQFSQKTRLVQEGKPIGVQPENTIQTYKHNKE